MRFLVMGKQTLNIILLLLFLTLAPASAQAVTFKNAVGAGIQYGGFAGWQGSLISGNNKFRLSVGVIGFTWGYDRYFGSNFSVGGQLFGNQWRVGAGLNANYHLNPKLEPGFVFGLDVYRGVDPRAAAAEAAFELFFSAFDFDEIDIDAEVENGVFVSVGYQF